MKRSSFFIICSSLILPVFVGCANSPAQLGMMSDANLVQSLSKESSEDLCRIYLRGLMFYFEDPSSRLASNGVRTNNVIASIFNRRNVDVQSCATPEAIAAIKSKIENERTNRNARALNQSNKSQTCVSSIVGATVVTNCF